MPGVIRGREWKWWVVRNHHECRFCYEECDRDRDATHTILGPVAVARLEALGYRNVYQGHPRYWGMLYHVFMEHMKQAHPEILAASASATRRPPAGRAPRLTR